MVTFTQSFSASSSKQSNPLKEKLKSLCKICQVVKSALGLDTNVGALLCYLPICAISLIYSIIVLVTDKDNKIDAFSRFSVAAAVSACCIVVVVIALMIVGVIVVGDHRFEHARHA